MLSIFFLYLCKNHGSYDSLPLEKTLSLHNVIKLIKLDFNKNKVHYYYYIFLEKFYFPKNNNSK